MVVIIILLLLLLLLLLLQLPPPLLLLPLRLLLLHCSSIQISFVIGAVRSRIIQFRDDDVDIFVFTAAAHHCRRKSSDVI